MLKAWVFYEHPGLPNVLLIHTPHPMMTAELSHRPEGSSASAAFLLPQTPLIAL